MARHLLLAALQLVNLALAQTILDGIPVTEEIVAPAVEEITTSPPSAVEVLPFEERQLTPNVIANLTNYNLSDVQLFDFEDADEALGKRTFGRRSCKTYPGDSLYPHRLVWGLFNILLGGALIEGTPPASVCYSDWHQYNQASEVRRHHRQVDNTTIPPLGYDYPIFEGVSCLPPPLTRTGASCIQGGLPSYVVKATNVAQIQLAVNFARNLNLRLVVKNKGHDFNAKSTGAGALSIWTHHLQDIKYLGKNYNHRASGYQGPAFKIGSGVTAIDLYQAADNLGLHVLGGAARTVGIGGGYTLGGGHSPLSSMYGMAADQVLSMQVVLPSGKFITVDEKNYPDLFFALCGGGGGTWGVVTSLVIRAYPRTPVTTLTYNFASSADVAIETFWKGVDAVMTKFPEWADAGMYHYWSIMCLVVDERSFAMAPSWGNDMDTAAVKATAEPLFEELTTLGIAGTWAPETEQVGVWNFHTGSRLLPRSNWADPAKLAAQTAALRQGVENAGMMLGYTIKAAENPSVNQTNAVNPAWRETLSHTMLGATWGPEATPQEIADANKRLVEWMQPWRDASPGAGAYLNEADINEPNWKQAFYGEHYDYLYQLKQKYDPWGLLYAPTAVGAEDWYITDQIDYYPTQNGRLCPK
ncbi:hypothetical protein DL766_007703 [Monosporascus sp. MC13-8B]|uniref:FAD-binding PCMH-type domain-containing protein n=1 Tax=Monosporascus cannonballus TaxID=155416 RepID=A0ABY0GZE4_9PEZI|nr:hypothetical protein DL763_010771 [Monosporascus cannonballus]RYO81042.1 hypothetical protein DL762_007345 [Monosporascus cannonballus]RYP22602.1 hypothetical protein DL766_007703 [Monosporascus sp. MC13-8B]